MKWYLSLFVLAIALSICSCAAAKEITTIGDLAYSKRIEDGNRIYLLEKDEYCPYLVLTDDYDGKTLLLREEILPESRRINDYSSYYENSEIDIFLNEEFIKYLKNREMILPTNIEIASDDSIGFSGVQSQIISRKIFLLSCDELALDLEVNAAKEGIALDYFKRNDHRIANNGGQPTSWWLRSPNTYYVSCTYGIGFDGKIGYGNASDSSGIRPAFCISSKTKIELSDTIIPGESVFTIADQK